jgi:hypothetical protein
MRGRRTPLSMYTMNCIVQNSASSRCGVYQRGGGGATQSSDASADEPSSGASPASLASAPAPACGAMAARPRAPPLPLARPLPARSSFVA